VFILQTVFPNPFGVLFYSWPPIAGQIKIPVRKIQRAPGPHDVPEVNHFFADRRIVGGVFDELLGYLVIRVLHRIPKSLGVLICSVSDQLALLALGQVIVVLDGN
jgi:hypothetical protein